MYEKQIMLKVKSIEDFTTSFSEELNSIEEDTTKQVFFLDNQQKIKESLSYLRKIVDESNEHDVSVSILAKNILDNFTENLNIYRNSQKKINKDNENINVPKLTKESFEEALKNNKTTQDIVTGIQEIDENSKKQQASPNYTHTVSVDGSLTFLSNVTNDELSKFVAKIIDENPGKEIKVYAVSFKELQIKTKTIVTVE